MTLTITITVSRGTTRLFYCSTCKRDIRATNNDGTPRSPCAKCGAGVEAFVELSAIEAARFFDSRKGEPLEVGRVFFCGRESCRRPVINWNGEDVSEPCFCGSRMFSELIGPEKENYLIAAGGRGGE